METIRERQKKLSRIGAYEEMRFGCEVKAGADGRAEQVDVLLNKVWPGLNTWSSVAYLLLTLFLTLTPTFDFSSVLIAYLTFVLHLKLFLCALSKSTSSPSFNFTLLYPLSVWLASCSDMTHIGTAAHTQDCTAFYLSCRSPG